MFFHSQNHSPGPPVIEIIILLAFFGVLTTFAWAHLFPTPVIEVEASVINVEEKALKHNRKGGHYYSHHCYIYVVEKGKESRSTIQFATDSAKEAKVYCDAIQKDNTYLFTVYDEAREIKTAEDYTLLKEN